MFSVLTYGCLTGILVQFLYCKFSIIAGIVSVGRCDMIFTVLILFSNTGVYGVVINLVIIYFGTYNTKGAIYGANSLMYIASSWQGYQITSLRRFYLVAPMCTSALLPYTGLGAGFCQEKLHPLSVQLVQTPGNPISNTSSTRVMLIMLSPFLFLFLFLYEEFSKL